MKTEKHKQNILKIQEQRRQYAKQQSTVRISLPLKRLQELSKSKHWKGLGVFSQRLLLAFPKGHCCMSYAELGKVWGVSNRVSAYEWMSKYIACGFVEKVNNYVVNKKTGETLGKHLRNYYRLTELGLKYYKEKMDWIFGDKKLRERYRNIYQESIYITPREVPILLINKPRGFTSSSLFFQIQNLTNNILGTTNHVSTATSSNTLQSISSCASASLSQEGKNKSFLPLSTRTIVTKTTTYRKHEQSTKAQAILKLFKTTGFSKFYSTAYKATLCKLLTISFLRIKKVLRLLKRKLTKGYQLKSFWGWVMSQLNRKDEDTTATRGWFHKLAVNYREGSDGEGHCPSSDIEKLKEGVDTAAVLESIQELEKGTGIKANVKSLKKICRYSPENIVGMMGIAKNRMNLNWEKKLERDIEKAKDKAREIFNESLRSDEEALEEYKNTV